MAYLIDTNIAIALRDGESNVLTKFSEHATGVAMSALTLVELERGLYKNPALTAVRTPRLDSVVRHIPVLPFDADAARAYGLIIAQCGWSRGRDYDRMIAAHSISTRSILVTNNASDFADIPGLTLENWSA
ncbi:MAG TPA: type II toxin-antitoxin system VapC family toxin [Rhizomicrobium sp.]|nr:type II toxin-antitoxin system VapC family toxin [Rhizomicrobium sp.]